MDSPVHITRLPLNNTFFCYGGQNISIVNYSPEKKKFEMQHWFTSVHLDGYVNCCFSGDSFFSINTKSSNLNEIRLNTQDSYKKYKDRLNSTLDEMKDSTRAALSKIISINTN